MSEQDYILKLIDPVLYGNSFDCAVSLEEIHAYSLVSIEVGELRLILDDLVGQQILGESDGFYHVPGRSNLAEERPGSIEKAEKLHVRALRVAAWLRHLPFVRNIYLSGSVAAKNAEAEADLDFMIMIARNRLGTAFLMLGPLSRLLSREVFCPNYYICEDRLLQDRRSHYVAREVVQANPLLGKGNPFLDANDWVRERFPNFQKFRSASEISPGSLLQSILEWPLRGRLGNFIERRARNLAQKRLDAHHEARGFAIPKNTQNQFDLGDALRFHASQKVQSAENHYQQINEDFAVELQHFRSPSVEDA